MEMSVTTPVLHEESNENKPKKVDTLRFEGIGMNFKGKLIGIEVVSEPRGEKMCQIAMAKIKAVVTTIGEHKQRISVNITLDGIKIIDEKTEKAEHSHAVHRISFISRDTGDSRAFGYVYNREDGVHQFIGIKTEKAAEPAVAALRDLFQTVFELKKQKEAENPNTDGNAELDKDKVDGTKEEEKKAPPSDDLFSIDATANQQQQQQSLSVFDEFSSPSSSSQSWLSGNMFAPPAVQNNVSGLPPMGSPFGPMGSMGQTPGPMGVMPSGQYYALGSTSMIRQQQPFQQQPFQQHQMTSQMNVFSSSISTQNAMQGGVGGGSGAWPSSTSPFNQPAPSVLGGGGGGGGGGGPLLQPTSLQQQQQQVQNSDPFGDSAFPDPFADFAKVTSNPIPPAPGKKTSKDDFTKEPPKKSLLDLSQQQQQQQNRPQVAAAETDQIRAPSNDPFGGSVNPSSRYAPLLISSPTQFMVPGELGSPWGVNSPHYHHPFAVPVSSTLDKSRAVHLSAQDFGALGGAPSDTCSSTDARWFPNQQQQSSMEIHYSRGNQSSSVLTSRPRPRSSTGMTAGNVILPLSTAKTNDNNPFNVDTWKTS